MTINIATYSGSFPVSGFWDGATFDETSTTPNVQLLAQNELRRIVSASVTDAEVVKRVEAMPPVSSEAAMLALTYGNGVNQVQLGDEVYRQDTKTWFKFSGASQTDVSDVTQWSELDKPTLPGGGRYTGDASTWAALPTQFSGGALAANDKAFLLADDASGPYPRGWYNFNGLIWQQWRPEVATTPATATTETVTLATLPAEAWTPVTGTTVTAPVASIVRDSSGIEITNSILQRLNAGKVELRSSVAMTGLQVTLRA